MDIAPCFQNDDVNKLNTFYDVATFGIYAVKVISTNFDCINAILTMILISMLQICNLW